LRLLSALRTNETYKFAEGMTPQNSTIYLPEKAVFSAEISAALTGRGFAVENFTETEDQIEKIDGVVLFHDNHNFDRHVAELRDLFDLRQVAMHKIDLSGTLNVALSHLSLFFDRTKCRNVLFLGSDNLKNHPKLELFKEKWTV
jgi:hypothetical protein